MNLKHVSMLCLEHLVICIISTLSIIRTHPLWFRSVSLIFIIFSHSGSPVFTWSYRMVRLPLPRRERPYGAMTSRDDVGCWTGELATMATTARCWKGTQWSWPRLGIWRMFICSRCICCSVIALASDESLASNFLSFPSLVSPPVVAVPRCVLTEASVFGFRPPSHNNKNSYRELR